MTQITALSFALLFPNNCMSLALNWVTDPCQLEPCLGPIEQLLRTWPTPRDYDQCEAYAHEASMYYAPNDTDVRFSIAQKSEKTRTEAYPRNQTDRHLRDQLVEHFLTRYPPTASDQLAATELVLCRRRVFGEELAHVQQPVLILRKFQPQYLAHYDLTDTQKKRLT